jgi:hypothetical protein
MFARRSPSKLVEAFARIFPAPFRNFGICTESASKPYLNKLGKNMLMLGTNVIRSSVTTMHT